MSEQQIRIGYDREEYSLLSWVYAFAAAILLFGSMFAGLYYDEAGAPHVTRDVVVVDKGYSPERGSGKYRQSETWMLYADLDGETVPVDVDKDTYVAASIGDKAAVTTYRTNLTHVVRVVGLRLVGK